MAVTPEELLEQLPPFDEGAALQVVESFLEQRGDVTEALLYDLSLQQKDPDRWLKRALAVRKRWFAAKGLPVPKLASPAEPLE